MLLEQLLARWQCPVASSEIMDVLLQVMRAVSYWHTATAIKMASRVGALFHRCFVQCCPSTSSCQGNTEQVVA